MRRSLVVFGVLVLSGVTGVATAFAVDTAQSQAPATTPRHATPRPTVVVDADTLSVRIRDVPWDVVADEIERQTGIEVHLRGHVVGTVTQEFDRVPIEEGMRRLFRDTNYLLLYESQPGPTPRLASIWVLSTLQGLPADARRGRLSADDVGMAPHPEGAPEAASHDNPDLVSGNGELMETRLTDLAARADVDDQGALQQAVLDPDPILQSAALDLLAARDRHRAVAFLVRTARRAEQAEERLQALTLLHHTAHADEGTIVSALTDALADESASVKGYAIQALAERGGAEALRPLRAIMQRDPDSAVRIIVIAHVSPTGEGRTLLREALSDADESLRSAAAAKLAGAAFDGR